jgi:hypothetical protein
MLCEIASAMGGMAFFFSFLSFLLFFSFSFSSSSSSLSFRLSGYSFLLQFFIAFIPSIDTPFSAMLDSFDLSPFYIFHPKPFVPIYLYVLLPLRSQPNCEHMKNTITPKLPFNTALLPRL